MKQRPTQQKPNLAKAPAWKLIGKKTQHSGNEKKPSIVETRTAKINATESSHGSVSDSRRPPVKVRVPWSYDWKDIRLTKSWFFYSHLFLVSSNPRWTGKRQWVQMRYSGRGYSSVCPKGSAIYWAPVAVTQAGGSSSVLNLLCAKGQANKIVSTGQVFSRFSGNLWNGFLSTFCLYEYDHVIHVNEII